jgi:tRNA-dihydrouridine synthase
MRERETITEAIPAEYPGIPGVRPLRLGPVIVDPPLIQAPLLDYTNHFYRTLLRSFGGVGLTTTELVHARGLIERWERTGEVPLQLWGLGRELGPLAIQLWDRDPSWLSRAVRLILDRFRPAVIDLNFGCPSYQVSHCSEGGAGLLKHPERIGELVAAAVEAASGVPVTAKIRLGWDPSANVAGRVAEIVEAAGAAGLTVHGRFATQKMAGKADWHAIAAVRGHLQAIPLIGNGDITTAEAAVEAFCRWKVDGVMIGRAAVSRPWIFREIAALLAGRPVPPPPSPEEEREILLTQVDRLAADLSPQTALVLAQKYACRLGVGRAGASRYRLAVSQARSLEELRRAIREYFPLTERAKRFCCRPPE